ncbi:hypothetical protein ACIF6L_37185 [Kitasatospora sp. NPDC086009]|uniref:hypothetical protein n=1 Tax=unclassified Kitasatospora TaxID=2633591 RepID=UPI0037C7CA5F
MSTPDDEQVQVRDGEQVRDRSAEERSVTAPTPADVRAKAESSEEDDDEPEAPAADVRAP